MCDLTGQPITKVSEVPLDHGGVAGSSLHYVQTDAVQLVIKRMVLKNDYGMLATRDHVCRSVTLWQYGILDEMLPHIDHKIIACAYDGTDGWALLMEDLTGKVFELDNILQHDQSLLFLDKLAYVHATFWNDARLNDPALGICTMPQLIEMYSPTTATQFADTNVGPLPEWFKVGWETLPTLLPSDVYKAVRQLIDNPKPLLDAIARYPHTLLHMDYRPGNLAYADVPVALDWQLATVGLMTADIGWYFRWYFRHYNPLDVMQQKTTIDHYRTRLETYLGKTIDNDEWHAMVILGMGYEALRSIAIYACFSTFDLPAEQKAAELALVRLYGDYVMRVIDWL